MQIDIISCVPQLLESPFGHSIIKRAIQKKLVNIHIHDLRHYGLGKHRQVDDRAYGGEAGMVLMVEPIVKCIKDLRTKATYDEIIYMAPDGIPFSQQEANRLSLQKNILILCGHYKGIDERIRQHFITREISIGNYVLSGGELAAAVIVDSVVRLLPGVLSDATSALTDSFQDGLIAPGVYTRPADFRGIKVPKVLLSGHTANIKAWRREQTLIKTQAYAQKIKKKL